MKRRRYARGGRRQIKDKAGMNRTEAAFASILDREKIARKIDDYVFEGVTLKLAADTRLTPDFAVWLPDGEVVLYDTKASWGNGKPHIEDDAWVKLKTAREMFGFRIFVTWPRDRHKLIFDSKEVGA